MANKEMENLFEQVVLKADEVIQQMNKGVDTKFEGVHPFMTEEIPQVK